MNLALAVPNNLSPSAAPSQALCCSCSFPMKTLAAVSAVWHTWLFPGPLWIQGPTPECSLMFRKVKGIWNYPQWKVWTYTQIRASKTSNQGLNGHLVLNTLCFLSNMVSQECQDPLSGWQVPGKARVMYSDEIWPIPSTQSGVCMSDHAFSVSAGWMTSSCAKTLWTLSRSCRVW